MKKKFMLFLFCVIFFSSMCTAGIICYYGRNTMEQILQNYQQDILREVKSKIEVFDELLFLIEKDLEKDLSKKIRDLERQMVRDGEIAQPYSETDLEKLAEQSGIGEIYLINRQGVIYNTSFEPDKNFDLFKTDPKFKKFLLSLYGTGRIGTQRAAISNNTGIINFYMYLSPKNSDFIIEISMPLSQYVTARYSPEYYKYLLGDFLVRTSESSPYIQMIDIYSKTTVAGWSLIHQGKKIDISDQLIQQLENGEKILTRAGNKTTLYMPLTLDQRHFDFMQTFYVEVIYDFGILNNFVKHATIISILITLVIIGIFFLFSSRLFNTYVIERIMIIKNGLRKMEEGEFKGDLVLDGDDELSQIAEDITRMKKQVDTREQVIGESEARYRTLFEHVPIGLFRATREGEFVDVNPALVNMLGYPNAESLRNLGSQGLYKIMTEHRRFRLLIDSDKMVHGFKSGFTTRDGKTVWGEITCGEVEDSQHRAFYFEGSLVDISPRVEARKALVENERKYRNIVESLAEGYFELDLAGNLTFFNQALCQITGYTSDELMGMNNREYSESETAKRMFQVFNKIFRTGNPARVLDYEILRKDGTIAMMELSAYLIRDGNGNPAGFRGIVRDISEKIQAQKQRKHLEKQLQQAQRLEAVGKLAGGIAHDFNNLLTIMLGNINMLTIYLDKNHPDFPKWHDRIKKIEQQLDGASHLTQQLLNFAKGGKTAVRSLLINDIITETLRMFSRTGKGILIQEHLYENLWPIEADPGQMEQVFINLFVNAHHAMPDGGSLFIRTENCHVDEPLAETFKVSSGKYVMITIRDTGLGMDTETQNRIFEPFFTTKKKGLGTGLGLSSVYGIIQSHKGIITVSSKEKSGTVFKIYLPATEKPVENITVIPSRLSRGTGTILLVDDEADIREVCSEMLAEAGYRVIIADSGQKALEIYEKFKDEIDLVILDMVMPEMSGEKTFHALKSIDPKVKILLASGYIKSETNSRNIKEKSDGFIRKPFTLIQISEKIRQILGEKRGR